MISYDPKSLTLYALKCCKYFLELVNNKKSPNIIAIK